MTTTKNNEHKKLNFSSEREQSQACLNSAEHEKNQGRKVLNVPNSTDKGNVIRNVPHLRFPEFEGEWEDFLINDVCSEFKSGKNIKADSISESGEYPVYGGNGLRGYTSSYNHEGLYVLIGRQGALCGNVRSVHGKTFITEHAIAVAGNEISNTSFLHYLFVKMNLGQYSDQSAQPGLAVNKLLKIKVVLPSVSEQTKIARFLSLLDERITTQNKIIDKLQSLIKGIAQHSIRELINGWEHVRLGDICKITTGKLDANAQVENGQYPFFTCAERPFNIDSYAFDTEALLISGNGANLGYINYYKGKFNAYQRTYVLDHFSVNIQYVKWALKVLLPQRIAIEKSSSNTPYIVLSTLADLKIPIPNNSKQNHIADLMMSFERKLSTQLALSDLYNKQKQYLLRQMFI